MKNILLFIITITIILTGCTSKKAKLEQNIKTTVRACMKSLLGEDFTIDTLILNKIDTSTQRRIMYYTSDMLLDSIKTRFTTIEQKSKKFQNDKNIYNLTEDYGTRVELRQICVDEYRDKEEANKERNNLIDKRDSILHHINDFDNLKFLFYHVSFIIKFSNKALFQKEIDGELFVTSDFKLKDRKDFVAEIIKNAAE
jgi:hypothetical protein